MSLELAWIHSDTSSNLPLDSLKYLGRLDYLFARLVHNITPLVEGAVFHVFNKEDDDFVGWQFGMAQHHHWGPVSYVSYSVTEKAP